MKIKQKFILLFSNPKKFVNKSFDKLKYFKRIYLDKEIFLIELKRWYKDNGDENLRLSYPSLNINSIVFDLGGYKGDFAFQIYERYKCNVYIFEPHPTFYKFCIDRFKGNSKIHVFDFGLSDENGSFKLSDLDDGSSLFDRDGAASHIEVKVREFSPLFEELNLKKIDLIKINIEGAEFPLLEHMYLKNIFPLIDNLQIQFHNFVDDAPSKKNLINQNLSLTHTRTWNYEFVWENWEIHKDPL